MKFLYIMIFITFTHILFANAELDSMYDYDNPSEIKELLYSCLDENKESCEKIIAHGLPEIASCNPKSSCIVIAKIYTIARKFETAQGYYEKSCKERDLESCFELALNYEEMGKYKRASGIYEDGCYFGFLPSCCNLGILYLNGRGVKENVLKANRIFSDACIEGDAQSCFNLAISHRIGKGVKADRLRAIKLFSRACELGLNEGCKEAKILESADFNLTIDDHIKHFQKKQKLKEENKPKP